jgi:hypothetical protein
MIRAIARGAVLAALAALSGACGSTTTSPTTPVATITETYSGTLIPASAGVFTFTTLTGGSVTSTLTTVGPDNTKTVGFSLGTYNGAVCTVILDNSSAAQGFAFTATTSSIGTYCVRIYDNGSTTTDNVPYTFTITVAHPQ